MLLMAAYWRTNLTLRQHAPLFGVSKSAADRIVDHTVAEQSKNYKYSTNHQVVIDADTRLVVAIGRPVPGHRHGSKAWEESGAKAAVGRTTTIADGGYPGTGLVVPHRRPPGGELPEWKQEHDHSHKQVRARVEPVFARIKTVSCMVSWSFGGSPGRCCRRRGCVRRAVGLRTSMTRRCSPRSSMCWSVVAPGGRCRRALGRRSRPCTAGFSSGPGPVCGDDCTRRCSSSWTARTSSTCRALSSAPLTSALSPTSHTPDGSLPTGRASCAKGAAKRSWPAMFATTASIRNSRPDHSRRNHWRAG